jgi:hypothetical protein
MNLSARKRDRRKMEHGAVEQPDTAVYLTMAMRVRFESLLTVRRRIKFG